MTNGDVWTANWYISGNASDSGKTRIPTLMLASPPGLGLLDAEAATNEDKSAMLAKLMFPACPSTCSVPNGFLYPPSFTPWQESRLSRYGSTSTVSALIKHQAQMESLT